MLQHTKSYFAQLQSPVLSKAKPPPPTSLHARRAKHGSKPTALSAAPSSSAATKKAPTARPFNNKLTFKVPANVADQFESEWKVREAAMKEVGGFKGLKVEKKGEGQYVVTSAWESIPAWEEYANTATARRSQLPLGVFQFVPAKGQGFPEDHLPFVDLVTPVNAKY